MDPWLKILADKADECEQMASWASQVSLGRVHDHLRRARSELLDEIARKRMLAFRMTATVFPDDGVKNGGPGSPPGAA